MQIKQLEFHPYINNNEVHNIFGEMAYVKDEDNNIIFYYLIIKPNTKIGEYNHSIMIAGQMHDEKFTRIENARSYCQKHFESLLKLNITKLNKAA